MAKRPEPSQVKVGVIGYGGAFNMGKAHLNDMKAAGMTPTAVAEIDTARLKVAAADFPGIGTYTSVSEMLKKSDVNLLAIITPHNTHADLAVQCLKAGRHVVCEKPFAITTAECDRMIAAARRNNLLLSTFHNRHWDGCILQAVKTIRSGAIGTPYRLEAHMGSWGQPGDWWRSSKTISGGVLYDWGVHLLEYTFQIMAGKVVEVSGFAKRGYWGAKTKWGKDTIEDEGFVVLRYDDGSWSTLTISSLDSKGKQGWVEVTGAEGSYVFDYHTFELTTHSGKNTVITKGKNQESEHAKFYQNVCDHLCKGTPLVISPEWARRPVQMIDLACQSAAAGKALRPRYEDEVGKAKAVALA